MQRRSTVRPKTAHMRSSCCSSGLSPSKRAAIISSMEAGRADSVRLSLQLAVKEHTRCSGVWLEWDPAEESLPRDSERGAGSGENEGEDEEEVGQETGRT